MKTSLLTTTGSRPGTRLVCSWLKEGCHTPTGA